MGTRQHVDAERPVHQGRPVPGAWTSGLHPRAVQTGGQRRRRGRGLGHAPSIDDHSRAPACARGQTPWQISCGIGSCGVPRPSLGGYVTRMGPTDGATAAGGRGPQGNPVQFPDSHSIPTSLPIEFPRVDGSGRTRGTR